MTEQTEPTVTVKTESFADVVERDAQNQFVALKMAHDNERLRKATNERLQELLKGAGLPGTPSEAEVITRLKEQLIDQYRKKRLDMLAEKAAQAEFRVMHPELFEDEKKAEAKQLAGKPCTKCRGLGKVGMGKSCKYCGGTGRR